jgi:hypothetical protein
MLIKEWLGKSASVSFYLAEGASLGLKAGNILFGGYSLFKILK